MNNEEFKLIYSIGHETFSQCQFFIGYFFIVIIINVLIIKKAIKRWLGRIILIIFFMFSVGITVRLWGNFNIYKRQEGSNNCQKVEGVVENFTLGKKNSASFVIGGILFHLPVDGMMSFGYRFNKGDMKNGDKLRLCIYNGKILRVEKMLR